MNKSPFENSGKPAATADAKRVQSTTSMVRKLVFVAVAMFGFGYLLVPLYDVFCDVTGLNGKAANQPVALESVQEVDAVKREVTVEFIGIVSAGRAWEFAPTVTRMKVPVGKMTRTEFSAKNLAAVARVAQAVPSVSPGLASKHLNKIECFCFNRQPLDSGEQAELPLLFMVDETLPEKISTITLTYTLFDVTEKASQVSKHLVLLNALKNKPRVGFELVSLANNHTTALMSYVFNHFYFSTLMTPSAGGRYVFTQ